jgi:HK97 family phage major capsid protein
VSTIKDLQEKRAKLITDAQSTLLADNVDQEKRNQAHAMLADVATLEKDIDALVQLEKFQKEERSRTAPNRDAIEVSGIGTTQAEKEKRSLLNYMLGKEPAEYRDITTSSGAALIPQSMYGVLTSALKSYGNILNYVKIQETDSGEPFKIASINDTAHLVTVGTEGTAVSEVDPTINSAVILSSDELTTGTIKVSLMQLNQSNFDVEAWVRDAFLKRYFRGLSSMVTNGNSSNVASMKSTATVGATTASPTAIAWTDLTAIYAALDPAYHPNAVWSFNQATRGYLLGLTDTLGRPLYTVNQMSSTVAGGFVDSILGHEVVINPFMDAPNVASNIPILFGDHSAYMLRTVKPGLKIYRQDELYIASAEVGFVGFAMGGGVLIDGGTHPLLSLAQHS